MSASASNNETTGHLTTTKLAVHYGVSADMIRQWRRYEGFPKNACVKDRGKAMWHVEIVNAWLRSRPIASTGRRPGWLHIVGHPAAQ